MDTTPDTARRLTELEVKTSFTEDLVERLNQTVIRQQQHIDALIREIRDLRQQVSQGDASTPRTLRDDLPPHY